MESDGWVEEPLAACVERVVGGGTPSRRVPSFWDGSIPWASVKDFRDDELRLDGTAESISPEGLAASAANLIRSGTPIICTRMAVGRCATADRPVAINQDLKALEPARGIDARFLVHALTRLRPTLEAVATGSTVRGISLKDLFALSLHHPPLAEQQRIATVLDGIDEAIDSTEQLIAKIQLVRQGLLLDLLTRGIDDGGEVRDPVRRPQDFMDSQLGPIPRTWEVATVEQLLADVEPAMRSGPFGSALLKHEHVDKGVPLLGIDNVHVERFVRHYVRFVRPQKAVELARYRVRPGDVMITIMGTVGRCCVVPDDIGEALSSKHVWTLTLDKNLYSPFLACLQFNYAPWVLAHFRRDEQGGIMSAIRSETIRTTLLPVPPREEQAAIESALVRARERFVEESALAEKLRLLKTSLTNDLLSGRVRIDARESIAS